MERETLLTVLIVLLGGAALHLVPVWPAARAARSGALQRERSTWGLLWRPLVPVLIVAAWLCGWALSSPDPVPAHVGAFVFAAFAPFALSFARAVVRAVWALTARRGESGIAAVGLLRPRIVLAEGLARRLDRRAMRAALEHEQAHVRHRDPLRIWLAQLVTDLQWPRASAADRFRAWLAALEQARDDEARARGVDGADLAAAVLASLRYRSGLDEGVRAQLTGDGSALRERITRLLQPLPEQPSSAAGISGKAIASVLIPTLCIAVALGIVFGGRVVSELLALTS